MSQRRTETQGGAELELGLVPEEQHRTKSGQQRAWARSWKELPAAWDAVQTVCAGQALG